jgi:DNA polymerase-3 subunit beta
MTNKQLIKHIKAVVNKKAVLPIIETVYLDGDTITISDLETFVSIPYTSGIKVCLPFQPFISAIEIMEDPQFSVDADLVVTICEGKRKLTIAGLKPEDYPINPYSKDLVPQQIGTWGPTEMSHLEEALSFVSTDDLRPAMTGVFAGKDIAATDAHRLFWKPIEPLQQELIIPAKTVKILTGFENKNWKLCLGEEYQMDKEEVAYQGYGGNKKPVVLSNYAAFISDDGIVIAFKPIDARFPQYEVVIPRDNCKLEMSAQTNELRKELKTALKFANSTTKQVVFSLNGSAKIEASDIDANQEYENEIPASHKFVGSDENEFRIAFNGKFLDAILENIEGEAKFKFWKNTNAAVINDSYLLMPLYLAA